MNKRLKRRLVVVTGVVVIVVLGILALVNGTASKAVTVAQAASGAYNGSKVQVSGKVVDNSYSLDGNVLSFFIYDDTDGTEDGGAGSGSTAGGGNTAGTAGTTGTTAGATGTTSRPQLKVVYDKGVSATFGNQVEAIATGTINEEGVLICTELVTKCPSKYENSTDALSVVQLLSYGESLIGKPVKLTGTIQAGTLKPVGQGERFALVGQTGVEDMPVLYNGAIPNELQEGGEVVLTGALNTSGQFEATDLALKG